MQKHVDAPANEVQRLQRCMNDLVSLLALPAVWKGNAPDQILGTLLDALLGMLDLDFVYAQINVGSRGEATEVLKCAPSYSASSAQASIRQVLEQSAAKAQPNLRLEINGRETFIVQLQMGLYGDLGFLIAGSTRTGFPESTERLVLSVATNQTALGLQQALLLKEQARITGELEHHISQRTAELRAKERELLTTVNTMPVLAWSALADGTVEFFNQRWLHYTGFSPSQAEGWGWVEAIYPEDLAPLTQYWESLIATGGSGEIEARLRRHDGAYRWFLFRADPMRDESGAILKWYGTNTDINDRKQAEEELRNTQAELARMMRALTIGQLTASIAHEVSQPLSGIITNASTCLRMLNSDPPNIDGARETVQRTIRDGNRATDVITRLRTLFSNKQINIESVDLNDAIREVVTLVAVDLQKENVLLQHRFAENLPRVMGDRVQLQQVILNLLRNASEAMSSVNNRPRMLLIQTETKHDSAHVSVQDAGIGFNAEVSQKLFESFFTTKQEGMGIGLSVSRSIIEAHHGRLWANKNDGPGSTFTFSIPCEHES